MGVLNITPDSFYDGGKFLKPEQAVEQAFRLVKEGADLLDLGAESTRPGAKPVSEEEELGRLLPILEALRGEIHVPISADTTKSRIAQAALAHGAHIVNDVSGLQNDPEIASVVKEFGAGLILMHRRGTPETMQIMTNYADLIDDVTRELSTRIQAAESKGVSLDQMVIDPGIGFAKTPEQSLELLNRLDEFKRLNRPILIGPSRKSFIAAVTHQAPDKRLFGTVAACVLALERGANIFRVHDVWAMKEALKVAEAIVNSGSSVIASEAKQSPSSEIASSSLGDSSQ
jgi:dihydropteroate synthase